MKKSIFFVAGITALLMVACKKDDDKPSGASLQNKWGLINVNSQLIENGITIDSDNYIGVAEDYVDFRSDNKVYSLIDGNQDIASYQILSNDKVVIDVVDTFNIQSLTSNSATLQSKAYSNVNSYEQNTINLKR